MTTPPQLPRRHGTRPTTTPTNPHTQLDQQPADPALRDELAARVFSWPDVVEQTSRVSVPGARALWLRDEVPAGPTEAFMVEREFAHLHPRADHSLHLTLPPQLAEAAMEAGWAELHPVARMGLIPATTVMVYAPRDREELGVVCGLVRASYEFAGGRPPSSS